MLGEARSSVLRYVSRRRAEFETPINPSSRRMTYSANEGPSKPSSSARPTRVGSRKLSECPSSELADNDAVMCIC